MYVAYKSKAPYPKTAPTIAPVFKNGRIYFRISFLVWAGEHIRIISASDTTSLAWSDTIFNLPFRSPILSQEEPLVYAIISFFQSWGLLESTLILN